MESEYAIEHPDDIARILVNSGNPPIRLAVEQQDLEEHFLQLTMRASHTGSIQKEKHP